jgi:hypothetical protein
MPYPAYTLIPKLITEYGFTGDKSKLYSSTFASAYTAAVIRQLVSGRPAYIFSFQLKDGPGQAGGEGWGLITHESAGGTPKPRYYVFNFIDKMAGTRLALAGEGTWVTGFATTKDNVYRVFLVNYDGNGSHVESVPVTINNLDNGSYSYKESHLFGQNIASTETITDSSLTKKVYMPAQSVAILELTKL